jgi:hypothetical protein
MAVQVALSKAVSVKARKEPENTVDIHQLKRSISTLKQKLAELKQVMATSVTQDSVKVAEQMADAEHEQDEIQKQIDHLRKLKASLAIRLAAAQQNEVASQRANKPLMEEMAKLRSALAKAVVDNKVFYIPEEGSLKTPVLVECSGAAIRVGFISRAGKTTVFSPDQSGMLDFVKHISQFSPTRDYFVFMIKPSSLDYWQVLKAAASELNFDVGYDALEEGNNVGFGSDRL